eukprot:COSAG03_NODE_177_length_11096_cov_1567.562062_2_plen_217_part_00
MCSRVFALFAPDWSRLPLGTAVNTAVQSVAPRQLHFARTLWGKRMDVTVVSRRKFVSMQRHRMVIEQRSSTVRLCTGGTRPSATSRGSSKRARATSGGRTSTANLRTPPRPCGTLAATGPLPFGSARNSRSARNSSRSANIAYNFCRTLRAQPASADVAEVRAAGHAPAAPRRACGAPPPRARRCTAVFLDNSRWSNSDHACLNRAPSQLTGGRRE